MIDTLRRAIAWVCGFAEVHAPQSMTRLCAFIFAVTAAACGGSGALLALLAYRTAQLSSVPEVIRALAVLSTVFVVSGAVALLTRSRPSGPSSAPTTEKTL